jgi:mRNA interferase RelE/StbE
MKKPIYKLRVPEDVANLIRTIHPHLKKKIKSSLQTILYKPGSGKALKGNLTGLRSFRVSRFRIIYRVSGRKQVEIIAIGPRERIYEETFRKLK